MLAHSGRQRRCGRAVNHQNRRTKSANVESWGGHCRAVRGGAPSACWERCQLASNHHSRPLALPPTRLPVLPRRLSLDDSMATDNRLRASSAFAERSLAFDVQIRLELLESLVAEAFDPPQISRAFKPAVFLAPCHDAFGFRWPHRWQ